MRIPSPDGRMAVALETQTGLIPIDMVYVVTLDNGKRKADLFTNGCSASGMLFGAWTEDGRHAVMAADLCEIKYIAVEAMTGKQVNPEPFLPTLDSAIRRQFQVPHDMPLDSWLRCGSCR